MSYAPAIDISRVSDLDFTKSPNLDVFALDIGGSLAKLVYKRVFRYRRSVPHQSFSNEAGNELPFDFYDYADYVHEGQKLCFLKFETRYIEDCLEYIRSNFIQPDAQLTNENMNHSFKYEKPVHKVKVTGGGAYKYRDLIRSRLNVELDKEDEMDCLIRGCVFMLRNIPDELFYYDKNAAPSCVFLSNCLVDTFPFLLVNIGSGVSILKVETPTDYQRVGGTSIGGGTFWGLGTLLSGGQYSFDELLQMADSGDHRQVDMLVRDIYGGAYETLGLPGDVIASSFGLAARHPKETRSLPDMVKSLLITVSNNIGQLACLYAKQHNLTRILFGGFFIRGHELTMEVITYAVRFWSGGAYRALFLRHEGYLGAVGAFLKSYEGNHQQTESKTQWSENYVACSSGSALTEFPTVIQHYPILGQSAPVDYAGHHRPHTTSNIDCHDDESSRHTAGHVDTLVDKYPDNRDLASQCIVAQRWNPIPSHFELDRVMSVSLELFPLLQSPGDYSPDTWDLTQDKEARIYWLSCLEKGTELHRIKAAESQSETMPDAIYRSHQYADRYINFLRELSANPSGRGVLTVRCLLSAQQHFLREFGFGDAYRHQKKRENRAALAALPKRLKELANLQWIDRQYALAVGLLAGNVFDWGAAESVKFMQEAPTNRFGLPDFQTSLAKIHTRPWLIDDYDSWIARISLDRNPYRCVLIFCDNSGPDILLGVIPFAMEFLSRGTKVILTGNSSPAINDVTFQELELLVDMVASFEPVIADALENGHLLIVESGQTSPCLDLRLIASTLVQLVEREKVDLVVIEGMGRAVHTNLNAKFSVDTLKVAVIKNSWLARRLGGDLYSVVFKYEPVTQSQAI